MPNTSKSKFKIIRGQDLLTALESTSGLVKWIVGQGLEMHHITSSMALAIARGGAYEAKSRSGRVYSMREIPDRRNFIVDEEYWRDRAVIRWASPSQRRRSISGTASSRPKLKLPAPRQCQHQQAVLYPFKTSSMFNVYRAPQFIFTLASLTKILFQSSRSHSTLLPVQWSRRASRYQRVQMPHLPRSVDKRQKSHRQIS